MQPFDLTREKLPKFTRSVLPPYDDGGTFLRLFSGGEQQRINIAHAFAPPPAVLLLDEPTAALDEANRNAVIDLSREARRGGAVLVGTFHDQVVRTAVATRIFQLRSEGASA